MKTQDQIKSVVLKARERNRLLLAPLPNKAVTKGQKALEEKHGTPQAFADACNMAIGEISVMEAQQAIQKYKEEWLNA